MQKLYLGDTDSPAITFEQDRAALDRAIEEVQLLTDSDAKLRSISKVLELKTASLQGEHRWFREVWDWVVDRAGNEGFISNLNNKTLDGLVSTKLADALPPREEINAAVSRILSMNKDDFIEFISPHGNVKFSGFDISSASWADPWGYSHRTRAEQAAVRLIDSTFDWNLVPDLPELVSETVRLRRQMLDEITYLGPLRSVPQRVYLDSGNQKSDMGRSGEFVPEFWFRQESSVEFVNHWLGEMGVSYQLTVQPMYDEHGERTGAFSVNLTDNSGLSLAWRDVGFGFSQFFPILMSLGTQPVNGTLLIEQPELHLHPRLQAELGDFVINSILARSDDNLEHPKRPTAIMETHSEHLLLRLMRRMRETSQGRVPAGKPSLTPEDVSIIYVHPMKDGTGSIPLVMDLDEEGNLLTAWPNGFFEEGFNERFS